MDTREAMFAAFFGFSAIASLTWFFSYRPRAFVRTFVSRDEYRYAVRVFLRDPSFGRGLRVIALLQFTAAAVFAVVGLWLWFR